MPDLTKLVATNRRETSGVPIAGLTTDRSTGGAGAAATVAISSVAGVHTYLGGVIWSYSAAPTGGKLTVESAAGTLFEVDISGAGPGQVVFHQPLALGTGAVTLTLAAPGGAVVGKLNPQLWRV